MTTFLEDAERELKSARKAMVDSGVDPFMRDAIERFIDAKLDQVLATLLNRLDKAK